MRCFGVYGKYEDSNNRFISKAIVNALNNQPIVIKQNVVFDYLYVDDLVKIIEFALTHPQINPQAKNIYNVGSGQPQDLVSISQIVKQVTGKNVEVVVEQEGLNKEYSCDINLLKTLMPQFHPTSLEQGIKLLSTYYK